MSYISAFEGRYRGWGGGGITLRSRLTLTIILFTTFATNFIICNVHAIKSPRSFIGRRRESNINNNRHDKEEGFTLGELDQMMQSNKDTSSTLDSSILLASSDTSNQPPQAQAEESTNNNTNHQLRRRLGKINLDLSGRIMCHLLSPQDDDTSISNQAHKKESIPLFTIPTQSKHNKKHLQRRVKNQLMNRYQRLLGAT